MKRQCRLFAIIITCLISLVLLACMSSQTVLADSYTSTTMRLLRFEGNVEIEDASGKPRAVMENARLSSGESMKTAAASSASVGLDEGRIVTLDEKSRVEFKKQDGAVSMNLTEGKIFLDVSEKLGEGESMGITTATMAIGIRGTIIYASCMPVTDESAAQMESVDLKGLSPEKGHIVSISQIGVLEGTAQITYTDNSNRQQTVAVEAGKKATVPEYSEDAEGIPEPKVSDLTKEDIEGFVKDQVASSASVVDRVQEACDVADDIDITDLAGLYTADGDWTWDSPVTLIAQSASKYYDGQPLTRSSDILVDGLPSIFTVKASAGGSRTDAGESDNPVDNYAIFNKAGQDVTRHFTKLKTVSGTLLVVPAPLTIHTGTAEKVYDGTVLTEPDAYVTFYKGGDSREVPWRNTSYVVTEPAANVSYDNQTLYGICGVIWVNAANPLTGERREIQLKAGQKLTVFISDLAGKQSIELKIEKLTENDLPAELLRLYADNPALLEQACKDAGWNISLIRGRIEALPATSAGGAASGGAASGGAASSDAMIEQGGLMIRESESDRLMQNLTNVRITVDTDITDYNNRALGSEEAHYSGLAVDESIKVTPTGRQTDVGKSVNTYTIDWGTANRSNYEVSEDLGTLTVTPASATITTGSASKTYDGTPLTNSEASISGLVAGETATVTATGTITEVGSTVNTYSIDWGTAAPGNYTVSESLGTLRVTPAAPTPYGAVTLTAASASKTYDGTALTADSFTVSAAESLPSGSTANSEGLPSDSALNSEGLPSGFTVSATVSGSQTDVGSSANTITSYTIYDASGNDVTDQFPEVTLQSGTLTVNPAEVTITTGSAEKEYDGTPLTSSEASISGLVDGETATVEAIGSITDVGSTENTYSISWDSADSGNYTVNEALGTLRVSPQSGAVTLTAASVLKTYDGTALTSDSFTAEGLPSDFTVSVSISGSQTNAGNSANTIDSYTIYDLDGSDVTDYFANIITQDGALTITPAEVTITTDSAEKEYDGTPLSSSEASISGLVGGETATVAASGSITDVGSTENTYSISWDSADSGNYTVSESLGTLRVTAQTSPVTLTAASADKIYDGTALTNSSVTAEGLPSGFTVSTTVSGIQTDAGNSANTIDSYTIYDFDGSDVTDYFSNIITQDGALTITPAEVTITTGSAEKEYDGTPLASSEVSISGLVSGETATVAASGSITDVGSTENTYSISWDSADSGNYTVSESLGTLRVTAQTSPVTLTAASADKIYDGTALTNSSVTAEGLPSGFTVSTTVSGSQTDAGNSANTIDSYTIYNSDGKDVTDYFSNIIAENGKLVVAPKEVTITTGSDDKEYDGTPLTNSEASISGLVGGETATVAANGSITDVGSTENTYSISWDSADSGNYTVTESLGTLAVNPLQVVFDVGFRGEEGLEIEDDMGGGGSGDGGSDSPAVFEYMGHPYFPEWILASYKGADEPVEPVDWHMDGETGTFSFTYALPGGAKLQLNGTGYTDAGSYTLEPEGTFLEGNKDNYKITFINNSLEITPAALTITASASKEYDGEPLVGSDAVKIEGLADGDIISVTATGTITNAGTADNPYTVDWLETNPNNYTVTQEPGILEVTAKKVTITTGSAEKVYDGETLFYNSYELSPSDPWVNGQAPRITVTGSITNAGIKPNTCMVEWKGVNPNNYAVTQELGTLTVRPVDILLISNCQYGVSGTISILEYGLKAQVNNLESTRYEVPQMGENRWWLQFEWGDKVEVQIVVTIDETSYAITPVHDFILGDSGNYKINTQDQAGELDVPPVYPIDGFAMGKPSTFSIVADRSLAAVSELADTIISNHVDSPDDSDDEDNGQQEFDDEVEDQQELDDRVTNQQELYDKAANQQNQQDSEEEKPVETTAVEAAPAPIESSSDELIQDANQEDKGIPEEPSDDSLPDPSLDEEDQATPTEEDPEEEPSEGESQSEPAEEVLTDE